MQRRTATLIGFTAVLMWAVLALLTAATGDVPPFQLAAMTFLVGGVLGIASWPFRPGASRALAQNWRAWALGVCGLFGYHALYYTAIDTAPPVEASLIAYLWPLNLVLFSALLPGERLRPHHIVGVLLGLAGAALVITKGQSFALQSGLKSGHLLAFACSIVWAAYSVLSRQLGRVPTDAVAGFCLATAVLALICHLLFEETVWPTTLLQWFAILGLGLFPVGAAFYVWDIGVKRGDIMVLGALSYSSPILSTLILVAAGYAPAHWSVAVACLLVTVGAVVAGKDLIFARRPAVRSG